MSRKKDQRPETRILELFLNHREFEQYKMKGATGLTYPTIIKYLKLLEAQELVICSKKELSLKGGKDKKYYSLTHRGLFFALGHVDRNDFEIVVKTYPDKLLTFKKWSLFKQARIEKEVQASLRLNVFAIRAHNYLARRTEFYDEDRIDWDNEKAWAESVDAAALIPLVKYGLEGMPKDVFMQLCKQDADLEAFIEKHLTRELSDREAEFRELQQIKNMWDKLKFPA